MAYRKRINGTIKHLAHLLSNYYEANDFEAENESEQNPYRVVTKELYNRLELNLRVDLDYRLRNLKKLLTESGAKKTSVNQLTRMDVIDQDDTLGAAAIVILKQMEEFYSSLQTNDDDIEFNLDYPDEYRR